MRKPCPPSFVIVHSTLIALFTCLLDFEIAEVNRPGMLITPIW